MAHDYNSQQKKLIYISSRNTREWNSENEVTRIFQTEIKIMRIKFWHVSKHETLYKPMEIICCKNFRHSSLFTDAQFKCGRRTEQIMNGIRTPAPSNLCNSKNVQLRYFRSPYRPPQKWTSFASFVRYPVQS